MIHSTIISMASPPFSPLTPQPRLRESQGSITHFKRDGYHESKPFGCYTPCRRSPPDTIESLRRGSLCPNLYSHYGRLRVRHPPPSCTSQSGFLKKLSASVYSTRHLVLLQGPFPITVGDLRCHIAACAPHVIQTAILNGNRLIHETLEGLKGSRIIVSA